MNEKQFNKLCEQIDNLQKITGILANALARLVDALGLPEIEESEQEIFQIQPKIKIDILENEDDE